MICVEFSGEAKTEAFARKCFIFYKKKAQKKLCIAKRNADKKKNPTIEFQPQRFRCVLFCARPTLQFGFKRCVTIDLWIGLNLLQKMHATAQFIRGSFSMILYYAEMVSFYVPLKLRASTHTHHTLRLFHMDAFANASFHTKITIINMLISKTRYSTNSFGRKSI